MIQKIAEDDYYTKSTEFRLWLRLSMKKYFEEMTADETRRYFKKFVKAWNNFHLDESYYKGIRSSQISNKGSTKYKWDFAKKIGKRTRAKSTSILVADQEDRDQRRRPQDRAAQRSLRKSKETDLEELVPKASGREAMLEKRHAQTAYHRRERSLDVELPEHVLMGTGGGDDYKSMLAMERRRKEAREDRKYGGGGSIGPSAGPRTQEVLGLQGSNERLQATGQGRIKRD
ncbi:hypothetical protein BGZ81_001562 [Podila clonocystis]|nr:hypothetical protein BGZ81_001562 [Podila clonocystis]